jgi:probable addiction module antidote protein
MPSLIMKRLPRTIFIEANYSFFWLVGTSVLRPQIFRQRSGWRAICRTFYMGKTITTKYDVAEHLRSPEEMAAYLEVCLEEAGDDVAFIAKALGDIARAKGMAQVARDAGLSRESLYKALSGERSPAFDTILKVIGALGLKLQATASTKRATRSASRSSRRVAKRRAA